MITFGEKIKHLRNKNHLTQKQLGLALGFSENSADIRIRSIRIRGKEAKGRYFAKNG